MPERPTCKPVVLPAINCRIHWPLYYKSLTPPPACCKAAAPMFRFEKVLPTRRGIQALGENFMTDCPTDLSSLQPNRGPRRSLLSARKFALMASVVAGLGVAVYGFAPSNGPVNVFSSPAHAQV